MSHNKNLASKIESTKVMGKEEVDALLNKYPDSKRAFAALLLLVEAEKESGASVCDWECDIAEVVWKEVQK
jgi:hypothetical protein